MSYALKFPGRTRQKKYLFSFFIMFILFSPSFPSIKPLGVQASESAINSVASPDVVGSAAAEFENIDSMDVHPANRWTEVNDGFTSEVSNGVLNVTDIGDNSQDLLFLNRDLRDLDGKIEVRFKIISNHSAAPSLQDRFGIFLEDPNDATAWIAFYLFGLDDNSFTTRLVWTNEAGVQQTKEYITFEKLSNDVWFTVRIDYDILKSNYRVRTTFDNGSKLNDHTWEEVGVTFRPKIFASTELKVRFFYFLLTDGNFVQYIIDYIQAPFKEREWTQTETASDGDWLIDTMHGCRVQDDIDDRSNYSLTIPYLDVVSGVINAKFSITGNLTNQDLGFITLIIQGVDADDGDLHDIFTIDLTRGFFTAFGRITFWNFGDLSENIFPVLTDPKMSFTVGLSQDRSVVSGNARIWLDATNSSSYFDVISEVIVANKVTDPSQEFVLKIVYAADFVHDVEFVASIEKLDIIQKDVFHDFGGVRDGWADPDGGAEDPDFFLGLFQGFADFITWLLSPIGDLIGDVVDGIGDLASNIWNGIGDALDFITDAIAGVVGALAGVMDDIVDAAITQLSAVASDVADLLFDIVDLLLDLLLAIIDEIWALIVGVVFYAWDAFELPDLFVLGSELLAYFIELIDWTLATFLAIVQLAADLSWIVLVLWWLWAVPIQWARANFDPLGGIANFIEIYFYDAFPWNVYGFHLYIPQGIVFTLWLILLLPAEFAIFGAMDL